MPVFESDTVICYEIRSVSEEIGDIRNPDYYEGPRNGSGNSGGTPTDPDKFTGQVVCYPKTNNQQPPTTINNSNIFNAGSGNNGRCPDVYISTNNQPATLPVIPNIYINNGLGGTSNEVQRLNQNLSCETNFPWWIVVLLSVSLASSLIYLNSQSSQNNSQNTKQKPVVVS